MATVRKTISAAAPAAEAGDAGPTMFRVTLNKVVRLYGIDFRPNREITVDQATLDLMGDAVVDVKPV